MNTHIICPGWLGNASVSPRKRWMMRLMRRRFGDLLSLQPASGYVAVDGWMDYFLCIDTFIYFNIFTGVC